MSRAETVVPAAASGSKAGSGHRFRPDVEGLRAIAIGAVVLYHAGLRFVPGGFVGVDVFFVISGFLITGLLVSEVTSKGRVSLSRFWARRARRLLPAATLVLVLTAVVSWFVVPVVDHEKTGWDISAAAVYVANMRFAFQATDYLQENAAPSPALHFWSLGVEEQFYVAWPLLMIAVVWFIHRRWAREDVRRHLPTVLAVTLGLLGLVSFVLSLRLTERVQPWAFFGMPARAWEFAVGGLLAIGVPLVARVPRLMRALVGWAGLVALVASILLIDGESGFPGTIAVWPVLATAAVIAAGIRPEHEHDEPMRGVPGLMSLGLMRWFGQLSYSWYLWHWPFLVLAAYAFGDLTTRWRLALVAASLIPAVIAYHLVEQPLRHSPVLAADNGRSLRLGGALSLTAAVAGVLLVMMPGGGMLASASAGAAQPDENGGRPTTPVASASPTSTPTVPAVAEPVTWPAGDITPSPKDARDDIPIVYGNGCHLEWTDTDPGSNCVFGDVNGSTTIALVGDSHAAQWFPAMDTLGKQNGWRVLSWTKSGCPAPDVTVFNRKLDRVYDECDTWRQNVISRLTGADRPDLVLLTSTRTDSLVSRDNGAKLEGKPSAGQEWKDGYERTIEAFTKASVPVVVLRDTPWPGDDVAVCVGQNESDPSQCDLPLTSLDDASYDVGVADSIDGADSIDLSGYLCTKKGCPATLGKYLVYRDGSHLTATFADAMSPYLGPELERVLAAR